MNKKQFATKLMASVLSASILAPCATTFGIERQNPSSKIVSTQKNEVEKTKNKKTAKKNKYAKAAGYGAGIGALLFGGHHLLKHRNRHGRPGDDNVHENVSASTTNSTGEVSPANSVNTGVVRTPSPEESDDDSSPSPVDTGVVRTPSPIDTEIVPPHVPAESDDTLPDVLAAAKTGDVSVLEQIFTKAQKEGYKLGDVIICCGALAPLRQTDEYDRTALYIAIMNDQTAFVNYWLEHFPKRHSGYKELDYNIPDTWRRAASLNDTETLRKLLARNDAQQYINWINDDNANFGLLNCVFSNGNFETALLLMQNGIRYSMNSLCSLLDAYDTNTMTFIQTLAFLHEQHFNFDFTTSIWRDGRYSTAAYWALYTSLNKPNVFRYYIEQLNVLSCMPNRDRTELRKDLTAHINDLCVDQASAAQELLNYFDRKCEEHPYVSTDPSDTGESDSSSSESEHESESEDDDE